MTATLAGRQSRAAISHFGRRTHSPVATVQHTDCRATNPAAGPSRLGVGNCLSDKELAAIFRALYRVCRKAPHLHSGSRRVDARSRRSRSLFATHFENTTGMHSHLSARLPENKAIGSTEC